MKKIEQFFYCSQLYKHHRFLEENGRYTYADEFIVSAHLLHGISRNYF